MKAVIMAGGKGTRLMPLTRDVPKPMIKLIDKPVLEYIIELLKKHGISDIAVTLGYLPESIIGYFGNGESWGVNLTYYIEETPLGTAGSVKSALNFLSDDFLVISGDCYTEIDLSRAAAFHRAKDSIFTLIAQPHPNPVGLGVLETDIDHRVSAFIEKPQDVKPSLINTGIYIINKEAMKLVPDGFYDFGKQLIPRLLGSVYACVDYSYWSDIGTLISYYETNEKLARELTREAVSAN